jgi:multidrug efflux pump
MVPVMITAPTVMWKQFKWLGALFASLIAWIASPFRRGQAVAVPAGFDGMALEVPDDADSSKRYIVSKEAGLTETKEANGVTVVSRRDAAE